MDDVLLVVSGIGEDSYVGWEGFIWLYIEMGIFDEVLCYCLIIVFINLWGLVEKLMVWLNEFYVVCL